MNKLSKWIGYYFESSPHKTPEFKEFVRDFRSDVKRILKDKVTDIKFSVGHFEVSGFLTNNEGQIVYFKAGDLRDSNWSKRILYRTAESYEDYTGGGNRYTSVDNLEAIAL